MASHYYVSDGNHVEEIDLTETIRVIHDEVFREGFQKGMVRGIDLLLEEIKKTDDCEFAMFSLGFLKEIAEKIKKESEETE